MSHYDPVVLISAAVVNFEVGQTAETATAWSTIPTHAQLRFWPLKSTSFLVAMTGKSSPTTNCYGHPSSIPFLAAMITSC